MAYSLKILEEELKNSVSKDFFSNYDSKILGRVDFCICKNPDVSKGRQFQLFNLEMEVPIQSYLWAEAKAGNKKDIYESFVQLILTIGKARTFDNYLPPIYLGAFDAEKIAFVQYSAIAHVFSENDFNWNVKPSDHKTKEFITLYNLVKEKLKRSSTIFKFGEDNDKALKEFIKKNFKLGGDGNTLLQVNKNNFTSVYYRWVKYVKPTIKIPMTWEELAKRGIIDADFFLADLLSDKNQSIKDSLFVLLKYDHYEFGREVDSLGFEIIRKASFSDGQESHKQFWNLYKRPPLKEYWDYIVNRRDLLVPQDIRERKGSYFTPAPWVELSQKYLASYLGENWQDEYIIWDCAGGTGNLLSGLTNKYNIWISTLDKADVDVINDRIENGANLIKSHVFQFDFLNDELEKIPEQLREVLEDPEKRKKLLIYINPPYAEATTASTVTGSGENKTSVATSHKWHSIMKPYLGSACNEIYSLFLGRIKYQFDGCKVGLFSTLKVLQAQNFKKFRNFFSANVYGGFIVPAFTFDNVSGDFPISFTIWDLNEKGNLSIVPLDVYDEHGVACGTKPLYCEESLSINAWIKKFDDKKIESTQVIGYLPNPAPDMQNNKYLFLLVDKGTRHVNYVPVTRFNLLECAVYFSIRLAFDHSWLNDRDQFYYPNIENEQFMYYQDPEFLFDCLALMLLHPANRCSVNDGDVSKWIPFIEKDVEAPDKFKSNFMPKFISGELQKIDSDKLTQSYPDLNFPLPTSLEAQALLDSGAKLWKLYFQQRDCQSNPGLFDIRAFFQGYSGKRMNSTSDNQEFNELMRQHRENITYMKRKLRIKAKDFGFVK